jgi:DNA polymerase III subunit gamma/tau
VGRLKRTVSNGSQQEPEQQQQSLYRRHRPRTFADVVGQEPVVRTLRNAVERGKVHHAYLFVGSRGTGKTSMAKILAACLNCERGGPTIEPCGECESCRTIAQANSMDVIEMDAASNNSVEDIRELRESVAYAPVSGRQKVYILDEAHMLSTAAWNAFLKTLEEPPPSTVFVLATTEAGKVPATVVDRCHRFDFHRPTVEQLASVVRKVASAESIEIPPEAVAAVARAATGSFRDALGTLEQLVTYSGKEIALADVLAVLGVADGQLLEDTFDAIEAGDARGALLAVGRCAESGRDAGSFASDLEVRARELLVVQTLGELPAELALTPEADMRLAGQAERMEHATVVRTLELLGAAMEAVRAGGDPRTQLELALVKAARPEIDGSLKALLARIERLEGQTAVDVGKGPPPAAGAAFAVQARASMEQAEAPAQPSATSESTPVPLEAPVAVESTPAPGVAPVAVAELTPAPLEAPVAVESTPALDVAPVAVAELTPAPLEAPVAVELSSAPREAPIAVEDLDALCELWPAVVDLVRSGNALLGALIDEAQPVALTDGELTVAFATTAPFLKKKAEDPANRATVAEALRELAGGRWKLVYELREELSAQAREAEAQGSHTEEEWVKRFMDEFDAEELHGEWAPAQAQGQQKGE